MSAKQFPPLERLPASLASSVAIRKRHASTTRSSETAPALAPHFGNLALNRLIREASRSPREETQTQEREADGVADRIVSGRTAGLFLPGNLSDVRIHTSGPASETARALHFQAFTIANHIVFAPGRFDPAAPDGKHLLAHELAHVAQQQAMGPRVQGKRDEGIPPYLWSIESRLRPQADRQIKMWAEEIGPLATLTSEFPVLPLREDVPIDIPYINPQHPPEFQIVEDRSVEGGFRTAGPPHGEFLLHSQLPGGYELVAYDPMKRRVLIGRSGVGYVLNDGMFAALFGENGVISGMFEEFEALPKLLHEKPWLPLAADLLQLSINIGLIWFFHELGAAIGLTSIAGEFAGMLTESGVAGAEAAAVGEIFEQLGGRELGYTVRICNESTVIETESGFENVGQLAKNQGGAYTNTATKTVWIDESVVTQGSITRAWGEQLTTRQILAHELGHVRGGGFNCAMASRIGADLRGLTAAERQGLLNDAVQIAPREGISVEDLHLPPDFKPPTKPK